MHELVLMSMEPCLFTKKLWYTVQKKKSKKKSWSMKKIHPNKQKRHIQRPDCKLPISIKGMLSPITAKLSLFQNKIKMVMMLSF